MIEFIPLEDYKAAFINFQFVITLFFFLKTFRYELTDSANLKANNFAGFIIMTLIILYAGLRPISYAFGDMGTYAKLFEDIKTDGFIEIKGDFLFYYFLKICSSIMPVEFFFLLCMFLYTYPLYIVSKRLFQEYWFYAFFMLVVSLSFWAYGTNGIRNGLGTTLFLLAITMKDKKYIYLLLFASVNVHQSMIIPIVMYFAVTYYTNTKYIFIFWLFCIPLSLVLGGVLETFFLGLGFDDSDKLGNYLTENDEYQEMFSNVGFRWDFLVYSATGVIAGLYFILKREFEDKFYTHLVNVYLLTNAIWILVIRANFSNRFAYLSWFMLGLVIIYPFLKMKFFDNQHKIIGRVMLGYFLITYLFNFILT